MVIAASRAGLKSGCGSDGARGAHEKGRRRTMGKFISIIKTVLAGGLALFIFRWIVYFFNLDMKLSAALYNPLQKIYDMRKRDKRL